MSRALIVVEIEDGVNLAVFLENGAVEEAGPLLLRHYAGANEATSIAHLGGIEWLGSDASSCSQVPKDRRLERPDYWGVFNALKAARHLAPDVVYIRNRTGVWYVAQNVQGSPDSLRMETLKCELEFRAIAKSRATLAPISVEIF